MNERENAFSQVQALLGEARLVAFLRAAGGDRGCPVLAVKLINDRLDRGQSLTAIFADERHGFELSAEPISETISESIYRIDLGCMAGPMARAGGTWVVTFDGDAVRSIDKEGVWSRLYD